MLVQQILASKSSNEVVSVKPGQTVTDAAKILSEMRIGAIMVSQDGSSADGILSERDIVRELGKNGPGCMDHKVSSLMTAKIVTCGKADTVENIMRMMSEGRFRHMPVVEDGKMIGLVSIGDIVNARLAEISNEKDALVDMIKGY